MNIFARGGGGWASDKANAKKGIKGRIWVHALFLAIEGIFVIALPFATSFKGALSIMIFFSIFVQAAEGTTFGLVPYVDIKFPGAVSGFVSSGGNVGGLIFTSLFLVCTFEQVFIASVNPLKKVPALIVHDQQDTPFQLFESSVIMGYLEDIVPKSVLKMTDDNSTAEDRALVSLIVRCHDLYIASPNCTKPNFSHTQGCMYLDPIPTAFTPARRTMNIQTRAGKVGEIYKQLRWLEENGKFTPEVID